MKNKKSKIASELGRMGGNATLKKCGKKHMAKIGKLGAKSRWEKHNHKSI